LNVATYVYLTLVCVWWQRYFCYACKAGGVRYR
jgi:hypothetical protein